MASDQTEASTEANQTEQAQLDEAEHVQPTLSASPPVPAVRANSFDVLALFIIIIIAASFALTTRLNAQPPSSLVPAAVLSATGCGLLVTALHKLRTAQRPGLFKAALAGFILALFQFLAAISYPGVLSTLGTDAGQRLGFLATWVLVGCFSIIFAIAGAALGHLAFAPLRPLPTQATAVEMPPADTRQISPQPNTTLAPTGHPPTRTETPLRSLVNHLITVLLLGLAPTLVGIVFSAAFDYMLSVYQFTPGPYPTSRLLSAMLPWQIPIDLHLDSRGSSLSAIVLLLWRIPTFIGNPTTFDVQALEPLVFNGAALSLLLLTMHRQETGLRTYLILEVVLGFFLVLPANLWMLGGLQGLLQIPRLDIVVPIRTLVILDQRAFLLNLITGPVVCLGLGLLLRESKPGAQTKKPE